MLKNLSKDVLKILEKREAERRQKFIDAKGDGTPTFGLTGSTPYKRRKKRIFNVKKTPCIVCQKMFQRKHPAIKTCKEACRLIRNQMMREKWERRYGGKK